MHGFNAVVVPAALVLLVFSVVVQTAPLQSKSAASHSVPAASATPTSEKALAQPAHAAAHQAITVAAKTYEALQAKAPAKAAVTNGVARAAQAKEVVSQLHATNAKAPTLAPAAKQLRATSAWPKMPRRGQIDAELAEAESQVKNKLKELTVQTNLEKEKEEAATQAQKRAVQLRARADKLRKEADVASQIAKEKLAAASKAEKGLKDTQTQAQRILEEERVMQKFLNQTKKEELELEQNITKLKIEQSKLPAEKLGLSVVKPAVVKTATVAVPEAMSKLVEENNRLKHEKAELEKQLSERKVAKEKAKLKQKLKNRLALADRHNKLQKRMLRSRHAAY